jgi:F-type H+-transporting ATPase subunit gamma
MAKARAIVKRRKAVRNIKKITKTMQMIATAKFQKSLKRAVGTKPYTQKVRELVRELAASVGDVEHPLLRKVTEDNRTNRVALVVLTSNRGLAGAYNPSVLRAASAFLARQKEAGRTVDLYVAGKKGVAYFNFQRRPIKQRLEVSDMPRFEEAQRTAEDLMGQFVGGQLDAVYIAYMNFISAGQQKPDVLELLPLAGVQEIGEHLGGQLAGKESQVEAGALDTSRRYEHKAPAGQTPPHREVQYDFYPDARTLLDELLPLTVKSAFFQTYLDATTSEHVARMVAMKSATDNADKMAKALTMQYNRARQSQITTELSEIMGGVEAMKG